MKSHTTGTQRDGGHGRGRIRKALLGGALIAMLPLSAAMAAADPPSKNCASLVSSTAAELKSSASCLGMGVGVGGFFFTEPDVVATSLDPGTNIVRITEQHQREASFWLEIHDTFIPFSLITQLDGIKDMTFGPFAALQLGGTSGSITSFAVGGMLYFPTRRVEVNPDDGKPTGKVDTPTSVIPGFGLGIGYGWTQVHSLGDGINENQPLPAGLNAVRLKQTDIGGIVVMLSTTVAL
jgi:hypothetical protein